MRSTHPLRLLCSKVHLYVGLALSLVLIVISITGSALVFRVEIDRLLNLELLRVAPGNERVSLARVMAVVREKLPESTPRLIRLPRTGDVPYQIFLTDGRHVYVDPYSGAVLGVRGDEEGVMNTLFALHTKLLAGETGERVVGVIGLLTSLLAATGLILWWPSVTLRWRHLRKGLTIAWRQGPRRLNYDLHRTGGFYTALFLVLVAATGSVLVFYTEAGAILHAVTGTTALPPPPKVEVHDPGGPPPMLDLSKLDEALRTARQELPGAEATFISFPQTADAPLTVRMRTPPEWHPNGRSYVYFVPRSGRVLRTDDMRHMPMGSRLLHMAYPLHIGAVGSTAVRVLYVLLGLTPMLLSVTGTLIWYHRWRKRDRRERGDLAGTHRPRYSEGVPVLQRVSRSAS